MVPTISYKSRASIPHHAGVVEYQNTTTFDAGSIAAESSGRVPPNIGVIDHEKRTGKLPCSISVKRGFPDPERNGAGEECQSPRSFVCAIGLKCCRCDPSGARPVLYTYGTTINVGMVFIVYGVSAPRHAGVVGGHHSSSTSAGRIVEEFQILTAAQAVR